MDGYAPHRGQQDEFGAFVPGPPVSAQGSGQGPLLGLRFAAKDLFDVAGLVTGCGNPDWAATHPPASRHAWAVQALLDAGATLVGRTVTDEISLGLLGRNQFHGTPVNPRAPDRLPGGSSSGSAAAVAGGLADLALGSDTGGSVRVPASFTGLFGMRPTHGRVPVEGLMTQAPSFDTVGFFARDSAILAAAGAVLLDGADAANLPEEMLFASDAFSFADPAVQAALGPAVTRVRENANGSREVILAEEGLTVWHDHQRRLQQSEFHHAFRDWIDRCNPRFSFEVGRSLALAALVAEQDLSQSLRFRAEVTTRVEALLDGKRVLCLPTVPMLPPLRGARLSTMAEAARRIVHLTCIAGLTGLPQVSVPLGAHDGIPIGLSFIGWRGSDAELIRLCERLAALS